MSTDQEKPMMEAVTATLSVTYTAPAEWSLERQRGAVEEAVRHVYFDDDRSGLEAGGVEVLSVRSEADVYSGITHASDAFPYANKRIVLIRPQQIGKTFDLGKAVAEKIQEIKSGLGEAYVSQAVENDPFNFVGAEYSSARGNWPVPKPKGKKALRAALADAQAHVNTLQAELTEVQEIGEGYMNTACLSSQRIGDLEADVSAAIAARVADNKRSHESAEKLKAEIQRLRRLVRVAYEEGVSNHALSLHVGGKIQPNYESSDSHVWLNNADAFQREMADADAAAARGKPMSAG